MTMYGANPEQLESLGTTLKAQQEAINSVLTTVSNSLGNTAWTGPARIRFEGDWNQTFRNALTQLNAAFDAAGNDCVTRANNLRSVMGAS